MYEHDENELLREALAELNEDVPPMPENLHAAWMQKVNETQTEKTHTRKTLTRFLSVAAAMVFVIGGTLLTRDDLNAGLNATQAVNADYKTRDLNAASLYSGAYTDEPVENGYAMDSAVTLTMVRGVNTAATAAEEAPAATDKKVIRTASMSIATQTFEDSLQALKTTCEGQGGWIESSSESVNSYSGLRTAYLTLRIPQNSLDHYLAGTENLGRITARSESAQDVTASYQDTQTRLNTQLALMERLQALITESGDLSDLLALESQIADTQYQIDRLQSSLNSTDRQVSYSTVSITLKEETVVELTDTSVSFWDRIVSAIHLGFDGLVRFLSDMVVFLVAALPFIAIAVAAFIGGKIIFKRRKK